MRALRLLVISLALIVAGTSFLVQTAAQGPEKPPSSAPTVAKSISLFNGKDLTGWHVDVPERDKNPDAKATFIVRDGLLVSLGQPKGHLITDVEYRFAAKPGNCGARGIPALPSQTIDATKIELVTQPRFVRLIVGITARSVPPNMSVLRILKDHGPGVRNFRSLGLANHQTSRGPPRPNVVA